MKKIKNFGNDNLLTPQNGNRIYNKFNSNSTTNLNPTNINYNNKFHSNKVLYSINIPQSTSKFNSVQQNPLNNSNEINFERVISGEEKRTTLMIKNIPNKYNVPLLFEEIKLYYDGVFDYLYIPYDFNKEISNLGYAFINFVHPLQILKFYEIFVGKKWLKFSSGKQCEMSFANTQGKENLLNHFEKTSSRVSNIPEDKKPFYIREKINLNKVDIPLKFLNLFIDYKNCKFEIEKKLNTFYYALN